MNKEKKMWGRKRRCEGRLTTTKRVDVETTAIEREERERGREGCRGRATFYKRDTMVGAKQTISVVGNLSEQQAGSWGEDGKRKKRVCVCGDTIEEVKRNEG